MRTYAAADWQAADRAWRAGDFSDEWAPWRQRAREVGTILYPPAGTKWDSWDEAQPSQRALLVRAMRETPDALRAAMVGASSWGQVLDRVLSWRDGRRREWTEAAALERSALRHVTSEQATESLVGILARLAAAGELAAGRAPARRRADAMGVADPTRDPAYPLAAAPPMTECELIVAYSGLAPSSRRPIARPIERRRWRRRRLVRSGSHPVRFGISLARRTGRRR